MKTAQKLLDYSKMTSAEVKHLENFEIKFLFGGEGFELNFSCMEGPQVI